MVDEGRSKKLGQVRKLLDKADDPACTPEEADLLRQKADDLMLAYAIQEHELEMAKPKHERRSPEVRRVDVVDAQSPVRDQIIQLLGDVAAHARCKAVFLGSNRKYGMVAAKLVGFPSDIDYVEMLFTSLRVQMATQLEPKRDPDISEAENIALMKESGMKWERMYALMYPDKDNWAPPTKSDLLRMYGIYKSYCADNDRVQHKTAPITYTRNFADGYVTKISIRLMEIKAAQRTQTTGKDLVLVDRAHEVDDLFRQEFPRLGTVKYGRGSKFDQSARGRGVVAAANADLGQSRVAKRRELT